ncbi:MAG: tetratricopeptide repeat protein [Lentisphaerae bacterium]|nr:tetratricopeptide repeat protein [Lentisphaerota bacterium]
MHRWFPIILSLLFGLALALPGKAAPRMDSEPGEIPGKTARKDKTPRHTMAWLYRHPAKLTPEAQLEFANLLREEGRLRKATKAYRALVYKWPKSREATVAQLFYAQLLDQRGKRRKAFDEYQYLVENYMGFFPFDEVIERQYAIAEWTATRKHHFLFIPYRSPEDAIPLYETIADNAPQWPRSADLRFQIGQIYEAEGERELAVEAYSFFQSLYPVHPKIEEAMVGQARCYARLAKRYPNSGVYRESALQAANDYLTLRPHGASIEQIRQYRTDMENRQAQVLYRQARVYDKIIKQPKSAAMTYERLIEEYPDSHWSVPARERLQQLNAKTGNTL